MTEAVASAPLPARPLPPSADLLSSPSIAHAEHDFPPEDAEGEGRRRPADGRAATCGFDASAGAVAAAAVRRFRDCIDSPRDAALGCEGGSMEYGWSNL